MHSLNASDVDHPLDFLITLDANHPVELENPMDEIRQARSAKTNFPSSGILNSTG